MPNAAPVLDNTGDAALAAIAEDVVSGGNSGTTVASLVGASISDADAGALQGIALIARDNAHGTWQYQLASNPGVWVNVSNVTATSALLLGANDLLRFVPDQDYSGVATVTYRAWDQTTGVAGATADTSTNGGATAFSSATETASISIAPVADVPIVSVSAFVTPYAVGSLVQVDNTANGQPYRSFTIDTDVDGYQPSEDVPQNTTITTLAGGNYVVVYQKYSLSLNDWTVHAQIFGADGAKIGSEIAITGAGLYQYDGVVTALGDGGFVIAFGQNGLGGTDSGHFISVFNADGSVRTATTRVDTPTVPTRWFDQDFDGLSQEDFSTAPQIIELDNGGFVVVYGKLPGGSSSSVHAQIFDANGSKVGAELALPAPAQWCFEPTVISINGGFAVLYGIYAVGPTGTGIYMSVYENNGGVRASAIRVDNTLPGPGYSPVTVDADTAGFQPDDIGSPARLVELVNGNFVVVHGAFDGAWGIRAQVFDANGARVGSELALAQTMQYLSGAEVIALDDGGFAIAFRGMNTGPNGSGYFLTIYNANGTLRASNVRIDDTSTNGGFYHAGLIDQDIAGVQADQDYAGRHQIVALDNGCFVVVYAMSLSNTNSNIYAQVFDATGAKVGVQISVAIGGTQEFQPIVTALSGGSFAIAWNAEGVGPNNAGLMTRVYSMEDTTVTEGALVEIAISAAIMDNDGSEAVTAITLSGFPEGATFSRGALVGADWVIDNPADIAALVTQRLTMTPPADFYGALTLTVEVAVTDTAGASTSTVTGVQTIVIDFAGTQDTPVAQNDAITANENASTVGSLFADNGSGADLDVDDDTLAVTAVNGSGANVGAPILLASGALLTVDTDGDYTYDPNGAFDGLSLGQSDTDSFTYTVGDGLGGTSTATVTVTINGVNADPNASDDEFAIGENGAVSGGDLFANNGSGVDSDVNGHTLTIASVNGSALNVGAEITLASGALLTVLSDGTFDYDPNGQFESLGVGDTDSDSFSYTIDDGFGGTDTATVTITINGANDAPSAASVDSGVGEGGLSYFTLPATDIDGDTVFISSVNGQAVSAGAVLTLSSGASFTYVTGLQIIFDTNGAFEALSVGDMNVNAVTVTLSDGNGGATDWVLTYNIFGENDAPVAGDDAFAISEAGAITGGDLFADNGGGIDSDADEEPFTVIAVNGSALNVGSQITLASGALLTVNANGTFDYNPNGGPEPLYQTPALDSFTYTIEDGFGGTSTATVSITLSSAGQLIVGDYLGNTLNGGDYGDLIIAVGGDDTVNGGDGADALDGGDGGDTLNGQAGGDLLYGRAGSDTLNGGDGRDSLFGGDGADVLNGDADDDTLDGGGDADALNGGDGVDTLQGRAGNDTLDGGAGADFMFGGAGDDTYFVDTIGDEASELSASGTDTVIASINYVLPFYIENLTLTGAATSGAGNVLANLITGTSANNTLQGLGGADTINAGDGADTLYGGDGADQLNGQAGADVIDGGNFDDTLNGGDDNDTLYGRQNNDTLNGDAGTDTLYGGDGADTADGGSGDDLVDGGNGNDLLEGGAGVDTLYGRQNNDVLSGGADNDALYGGDGDDALAGGDGSDSLFGGNGLDRIDGGLGADALNGGSGADTFVFSTTLGAGNIDTVVGFNVADDTIELSTAIFTGIGIGALAANAFVIGSAATTAEHRIIYDATTGALFYDADGDGAGAAVQFATLGTGLALTNADFVGGP